jgi:hypothetical protein
MFQSLFIGIRVQGLPLQKPLLTSSITRIHVLGQRSTLPIPILMLQSRVMDWAGMRGFLKVTAANMDSFHRRGWLSKPCSAIHNTVPKLMHTSKNLKRQLKRWKCSHAAEMGITVLLHGLTLILKVLQKITGSQPACF